MELTVSNCHTHFAVFSPQSFNEIKGAVDTCLKVSACATGAQGPIGKYSCVRRYCNEQDAERMSYSFEYSFLRETLSLVTALTCVVSNVCLFRDAHLYGV